MREIQTPAKEKDVDAKQLAMGIKVEMEHTDDPAEVKVIALQHLAEVDDYYTRLKKVEQESLRESFKERLNLVESNNYLYEASNETSFIQKYMKKFGIGHEVKSFDSEKGVASKIRQIVQNFIKPDLKPDGSGTNLVGELKKVIRKDVSVEDMPHEKFDMVVNRIARTELTNIREVGKLIRWKELGFSKVKHKAHFDSRTGDDSKAFNNSVFEIDFLLKNSQYRLPLRPNDRCTYILEDDDTKVKINAGARSWANKFKRQK